MSAGDGLRARAEFGTIEADNGALTGVIWATGEHPLKLGGTPTRVTVSKEALDETFKELNARLESGGEPVEISFDHPAPNSVAAQTGLGTVGYVKDVELSEDGSQIVMTDSTITNEQAKDALEAGEFDDLSFSVVGRYSAGETAEDGTTPLDQVTIDGVDLVPEGAVASANVGSMPALAAEAAIEHPGDLETSESFINEIQRGKPWQRDNALGEIKAMQRTAGEVIEAKDEEIERLRDELEASRERADAFDAAVRAQGLSEDAGPQVLIDAHTVDLREEVAELEASAGEIDKKEKRDRAEELKGKSVDELEARAGQMALRERRGERRKKAGSNAIAASESSGSSNNPTLGGGNDPAVEEMSNWAIGPQEELDSKERGLSASAYIEEEYGVDPSDCKDRHELQEELSEVRRQRAREREKERQ